MTKNKQLLTFIVGGILATLLPSPTDAVHFYLQDWLRTHTLDASMFWMIQAADWYLLDAAWWMFLLALYYAQVIRKRSDAETITVLGIVISLGALVGIALRLI